jgi:hypothetical protein
LLNRGVFLLSAELRSEKRIEKPAQDLEGASSASRAFHSLADLFGDHFVTFQSTGFVDLGDFSQFSVIEPHAATMTANIESDPAYVGAFHGFSAAWTASSLTGNFVGVVNRASTGGSEALLKLRGFVKLLEFGRIKPNA